MEDLLYQVKNRLLTEGVDSEYNIFNQNVVSDVISHLENINIRNDPRMLVDALGSTRLAKDINDLRRKCTDPVLAKRAKGLLKTWKEILEKNGKSEMPAHVMGNGMVVSPDMSRNGVDYTNGYYPSGAIPMQSRDMAWTGQKLPVGRPPLTPGSKEFRCIMCRPNELFDTKYFLEKHIKQKHVGFSFVCPVCPDNENFTSKYFLDKHMKQWHNPNGVYNRSTSSSNYDNSFPSHSSSYQSGDENNRMYNVSNFKHHNGQMVNGTANASVNMSQRNGDTSLTNGHGPANSGFIKKETNFHQPQHINTNNSNTTNSNEYVKFKDSKGNAIRMPKSGCWENPNKMNSFVRPIQETPQPSQQQEKFIQNIPQNNSIKYPIINKLKDNEAPPFQTSEASKVKLLSNFISSKIANHNPVPTQQYNSKRPLSHENEDEIMIIPPNKINHVHRSLSDSHAMLSPEPVSDTKQADIGDYVDNGGNSHVIRDVKNALKIKIKNVGVNGYSIPKPTTTNDVIETRQLNSTSPQLAPASRLYESINDKQNIAKQDKHHHDTKPVIRTPDDQFKSDFRTTVKVEMKQPNLGDGVLKNEIKTVLDEQNLEAKEVKPKKESVDDIMSRLPPIDYSMVSEMMRKYDTEDDIEPEGLIPIKKEEKVITDEMVDNLEGENTENFNGNRDEFDGRFRHWHKEVRKKIIDNDNNEARFLPLLPYCIVE